MEEFKEEHMTLDMPEPTETIGDSPLGQPGTTPDTPPGDGPVDREGRPFDAKIHVSKDGEPVLTKAGKLRIKPGVRPENIIRKNSTLGGTSESTNSQGEPMPEKNYRGAARAASGLLFTTSITVFGDEWTPIKDSDRGIDEQENIESAFEQYFRSQDISDFPPGIALCIAVGGYALPRFIAPKTKKKVLTWKDKASLWWKKRKLEKQRAKMAEKIFDESLKKPEGKDNAHDNSRDNGVRQDNPSPKDD